MVYARETPGDTTRSTELAAYLHQTGSRLSPADVTALAVDAWLRAAREAAPDVVPRELRGYQWKCLFLPHGSRLRMCHDGAACYAQVVDDEIIFQGRSVTPRGLTLAVAGPGRNAWRELSIHLPGEKNWQLASVRRRIIEKAASTPAPSPAQSMDAAAASMAQALQTVLALVSHVKADSLRMVERRNDKHRRASDIMEDACQFD